MRTHVVLLLIPVASLGACASTATQGSSKESDRPAGSDFSLQVDAGVREFRGDTWDELDDHAALGLTFVCAPVPWTVAIEAGIALAYAHGDFAGEKRDSRTFEASLGLRQEFELDGDWTFVAGAGGFAARTVDHDGADAIDADGWYGVYLHGGVFFAVTDSVRLGVDVRFTDGADPEIDGVTRNGDATQYALAAIFGF